MIQITNLECWHAFPNIETTACTILAQTDFSSKNWNTTEEQHQEIRNKEYTTTITICQIWKTPNISQSNTVPDTRQQKFKFSSPFLTFGSLKIISFADLLLELLLKFLKYLWGNLATGASHFSLWSRKLIFKFNSTIQAYRVYPGAGRPSSVHQATLF